MRFRCANRQHILFFANCIVALCLVSACGSGGDSGNTDNRSAPEAGATFQNEDGALLKKPDNHVGKVWPVR